MAATLKEIAEAAQVSQMTVSRILNGNGKASPETLRRVKEAVEKFGYQPRKSRLKRPIVPQRVKEKPKITLLLPCPDFFKVEPIISRHAMQVLEGALIAASELGATVETQPTTRNNDSMAVEWKWLEGIGPESLVLAGSSWHLRTLVGLHKRGCRIAMISTHDILEDIFANLTRHFLVYNCSSQNAFLQGIKYLIESGCRKIALAMPERHFFNPECQALKFYEQALQLHGNSYRQVIYWERDNNPRKVLSAAYEKEPFDALIFQDPDQRDFNYSLSLQENLGLHRKLKIITAENNMQYSFFKERAHSIELDISGAACEAAKMLLSEDYAPGEIIFDKNFII